MSRVRNTLTNAKVNVFFHLVFLFLQFFARKIFLEDLGDDFIGLTTTLQSFLNFLNLAELGIGTAVGFTLYKPIFNKDYKQINDLILYFGYLYKRIGWIVVGSAVVLSLFFPMIFTEVAIPLPIIYYTFFAFLFNSLLGYFFNYHLFLLQADQKDYIVQKYYQSFTILKILIQIILVLWLESYFWWITLELISAILYSISLRRKIIREYPWLIVEGIKGSDREVKKFPVILTKMKQISVHKLGIFVAGGTKNILIFAYVSVQSVAFFGNYMLIISNLTMLFTKMFSGTNASVGNLVAEGDPHNIKKVFWELMALRFFIASFATIGIYFLIDPFIYLWLGEKYLLSETTLILFCLNFFLFEIRQPVEVFKQAYGLYADIWAPITQSILNLVISFIFVQSWGIPGVLFGAVISSLLLENIWRPYYIYKHGFKKSVGEYVWGTFKLLFSVALSFVVTFLLVRLVFQGYPSDFLSWILRAIIISAIAILSSAVFMYIINSSFRLLTIRIKNMVRNKMNFNQ